MESNGHYVAHSTIIHGYKKAKEMIDNDQDFQDLIEKIQNV